ncbi:hypothetical protein LINGRAHAP2_LOCUS2435 [Linum grandiflorum]
MTTCCTVDSSLDEELEMCFFVVCSVLMNTGIMLLVVCSACDDIGNHAFVVFSVL